MRKSEDNLEELVFFVPCGNDQFKTQAIKFKCLYSLTHLAGPPLYCLRQGLSLASTWLGWLASFRARSLPPPSPLRDAAAIGFYWVLGL